MLLRANKDFSVLSKSIIFDAFVNLILVMIVVGKFGLYGLYAVLIIMPILNVVYIRHYVSYNLKYMFKLDKLISYIKFSFPLFISGILNILLTSVDSIMIAKMLDLKQLGYYSIGTMARSYSVGLSRNFNIVIAPHFLEDYGKAQDIQKVSKYLRIPALASSITMALLLGIGYFLIPLFVNLFLPQFKPGILAAQLFLLATYFEIASPQSDNFLVANNKQSKLMYIVGLALTFNIIFNYIYIKLGLGITGVTLATVISSFISFSIMLLYAASLFEHKLSKITSVYLITLIPLIYSLLILFILERFILINDVYLSALIKILLFTTAFIPFLWHLNRKTEIMKILFSYIGNKIRFK
jgi:O-antigen/teichoic acid export membrane protein